MHRIVWTVGAGTGSCLAQDGALELPPPVAQAVGATALALVGPHAWVIGPDGARPLAPGVPERWATASLTWEPVPSPARLGDDGTRGDDLPLASGPTLLSSWDGQRRDLGDAPLVIGRHAACGLQVDDTHASQFHCVLVRTAGVVQVIDLASTNGTWVDGLRVRIAAVARRATVRVGRACFALGGNDSASELAVLPSTGMRTLLEQLRRVAPTRLPVLVHGESGVGKDVVARHLHRLSGRTGALVALNAATLAPGLAASELFGHVRGAFTSAERDHAGAFMRAHEGTLFLDEVAELPLAVQAELLRAVELGRVRRVGEVHEVPVDVRIIAATHRDLVARVRAGSFREDLFHRLCVVPITVPPLRERPEDIDALTDSFLATQQPPRRVSHAARQKLRRHPWSGNVRELLNTLRRACTFTPAPVLDARDVVFQPALAVTSETVEEALATQVRQSYAQTQSVAVTARRLGLRRTLVHKVLRCDRRIARDTLLVAHDSSE
jgi:transcriptional regulator with GAF, ATPase, and Fis domain